MSVTKTLISIVTGALVALALFATSHRVMDKPAQFIDPIVDVFERQPQHTEQSPPAAVERPSEPIKYDGKAVARQDLQRIEL